MNDFTRRDTLKHMTAASTAALASRLSQSFAVTTEKPLPGIITDENSKPGTRDWMLRNTKIDPETKYRCPWVEGYASKASVRAGESISFHVSTHEDSPFTIDIYRLGYYQGLGGRLMKQLGTFEGKTQSDPPVGEKRVRNCDWKACTILSIPENWLSGVYVGKITESKSGLQSYLTFIVRDDRKADYLFQCSDNTWHAYNRWPSQFSLYDNGEHKWFWGKDVKVSYNRPYGKYCQIMDAPLSTGSGEFFLWEFPFAYWMESLGYDLTYASNMDTHNDADGLKRVKGFLSIGHDEYWTIEMYNNIKQAIDQGLNVGFFSGNAVCGKIVFDEKNRAFERIGVFGPPGGTREFQQMKSLEHVPPYGNQLMGAHSTGPVTGGADWVCNKPEHWIYADTGMKKGDRVPGMIGWEWHGDPAKIPGLEIVATDATQSAPGKPNGGVYTATVYPGPHDNFVFNASTCWWADGLSAPPGYVRPKAYTSPQGPDARIQQITKNILNRMIGA